MTEHLPASTRRSREDLLDIIDRLIAEFPDRPAGVVIAQVVRAREIRRHAGSRSHDTVMDVERAARERILTAMPA